MVTDEFAPIAMTLEAVVVKVVGSMIATSPLATSIVPLLMKVAGSMMSWPFVAFASIVPLLVKVVGSMSSWPALVWSIAPSLTIPSPE